MLRPRLPAIALSSVLALVACKGSAPAEGGGEEEAPVAEDDAAPESTKTEPEAAADGLNQKDGKARMAEVKAAMGGKSEEAKNSRDALLSQLNAGRKAVKKKDYDEGIVLLRGALEADPVNPKVLGELGFAAYKKGDLALAESSTKRAIDQARPGHESLGALYYNLGLIEEARDEPAKAKAAFARSLEARPGNAAVEKKLAKFASALPKPGPAKPEGLCDEVLAELECVGSQAAFDKLSEADQEYMGVCECSVRERLSEGTGKSMLAGAAVLVIEGQPGVGGMYEDELHLVLETRGKGWSHHGQLVNGYIPGVFGLSNQGSIQELAFADLGPAPGEELHVQTWNSELDQDMGWNTMTYFDARELILCQDAGVEFECIDLVLEGSSGTDVLIEGEEVDPDAELGEEAWKLTIAFADGKVDLSIASGREFMSDFVKALVGQRPFAEFMRSVHEQQVD